MRFYNQQHQYYCGVDLHARSIYLYILDADKRTLLDEDLPADPGAFLDAVAPYREGLVVGAECMFLNSRQWAARKTPACFDCPLPTAY